MIVHDINDKATSFEDSKKVSVDAENLLFMETKGLGHIRILRDEKIRDGILSYLKPKINF